MIAVPRLRKAVDRGPTRSGLSIRVVDAAALSAEPEAWDSLLERAIDPHPHFSRHVIEAHRASGLLPDDIAFVAVRTEERLDALLPFRTGLDIAGYGGAVARPVLSPYMPSSVPLVAADGHAGTLAALVAGLAEASGGRPWRWPLLAMSSEIGAGLLDAMAAAGWSVGIVESFERPVLDRRPSYDGFVRDHPHKGRLKDLRRRRRRLAEAGSVTFATTSEGASLALAVEAFLALERAGWKGAAGTALACRPDTLALARALFRDRGGPVGVRADTLGLDGRPLAVSLALVTGGTACLLKTAYDETARALAPGLVLEAEIVRSFHDTAFARRLDSASLAGSALESLYRERETIAEIVAVPPGGGHPSIESRVALARLEHRARRGARRLLKRDGSGFTSRVATAREATL